MDTKNSRAMQELGPGEREPMMQQLSDIPPPDTPGGATQITIHRPAYSIEGATEAFHITSTPAPPCCQQVKQYCATKCRCSGQCLKKSLLGFLPCIEMLRTYQWKKWIASDIVSGLSVGVIHIPQGMGFALLSSLPPVFGLYSSLFPMLLYFLFATSHHNSMGTMAVISLMIGAVVDREADAFIAHRAASGGLTTSMPQFLNMTAFLGNGTVVDTDLITFKVGIATSLTFMVGLIQLLMGVLSLGVVATFMSMPFVGSFQTGAAIHIITSQVPSVFGIKVKRYTGAFKIPLTIYEIFKTLDQTIIASIVCGIICLAVLVVIKEIINIKFKAKLPVPIPAELIIVVFATIIAYFAHLNQQYGLPIVGDIPAGIPAPEVPSFYNAQGYIVDSILIGVVSFAVSISMAKMMAKKHKYSINMNQELLAYGMTHTVSCFFHSFAGAQAPPRTMVHDSVGGRTQLASLVSCALVILTCYFLGPLLHDLPMSALASIIIVALLPLFRQFKDLPMYWRVQKYDFWVWVVTFSSVCLLDVTLGLFVGMGFSILLFTIQAHLTSGHVVKRLGHTELYTGCPKNKHGDLHEVSGVKIFTFGSALFFANVEKFKTQLMSEVGTPQMLSAAINDETIPTDKTNITETISKNGENLDQVVILKPNDQNGNANSGKRQPTEKTTSIVIDFSCVQYIDLMGLGCIRDISADYNEVGVRVALAGCSGPVVSTLCAAGIPKPDQPPLLFPTIHDAVVSLAKTKSIE